MKFLFSRLPLLSCFSCIALAGEPASAPVPASSKPLAEQIDALAAQAFPDHAPGGVVLVVRRGEIILRKAYGMADLQLGVRMQPEYVFRVGSITKQFTAVAILQLVDAGKIHLDDDVATYVPAVAAFGQKITIRQLLNHTSGLPSFTEGPAFQKVVRDEASLEDDLALIRSRPLLFPPGTDWRYVITGYRLLGAIIEKVSGQSYGDYLETHLLKPAGMIHSAYDRLGQVTPLLIPGYSEEANGTFRNAPYSNPTHTGAAAGLLTNVDDLWQWEQALASGRLVSPTLLAMARTNTRLPDGRLTGYGLGWAIGTLRGHPTAEHVGVASGFLSYALRVMDSDVYVVVLSNSGHISTAKGMLPSQAASLVLGPPAPVTKVVVPLSTLQNYVGTYPMNPRTKLVFAIEGGRLVWKTAASPAPQSNPLDAVSEREFVDSAHEIQFTFSPETGNAPEQVFVHPRLGLEIHAERAEESEAHEPKPDAVATPAVAHAK